MRLDILEAAKKREVIHLLMKDVFCVLLAMSVHYEWMVFNLDGRWQKNCEENCIGFELKAKQKKRKSIQTFKTNELWGPKIVSAKFGSF